MERRHKISSKNNITIAVIVFLIIFLLILYVVLVLTGWYGYFIPNPAIPKITQEEFDFEIRYSVDGEEYYLQDTFVCEYVGLRAKDVQFFGEQVEKKRVWKGYIKSTGDENLLIYSDKRIRIYCRVGNAGYYMGDPKFSEDTGFNSYMYDSYGRTTYWYVFENEESDRICDVQLISFEIEEPIENSFRYTIKSIFTWVGFD